MWGPSDVGFVSCDSSVASVRDPFKDAHVVTESWPEELAVFVKAEPVDVEEAR